MIATNEMEFYYKLYCYNPFFPPQTVPIYKNFYDIYLDTKNIRTILSNYVVFYVLGVNTFYINIELINLGLNCPLEISEDDSTYKDYDSFFHNS